MEYQILSPAIKTNEFYEFRKVIHRKTTLIRGVFIINKYKIRSKERDILEHQIGKLKKIDHAHLVKIYDLFKDKHRFYIVTELCLGESLADILRK